MTDYTAEVERLKTKGDADCRYLRGQYDSIVEMLHREQAEVERLRERLRCCAQERADARLHAGKVEGEVERLTNKLNADSQNFEIECLSSEVERLKHLIFVWRQASYSGTPDEYQRAAVDLEDEALRIRDAKIKEHAKHPAGDYCAYCISQWPCAEAGGE